MKDKKKYILTRKSFILDPGYSVPAQAGKLEHEKILAQQ
jgi:hypothetical protein